MGFGRHESPTYKDGYIYIRKDGNVVKVLEPLQIANFIHDFLDDRGYSPGLRDYMYNSPRLTERSFANLPALEIDFNNATRDHQYMFFSKKILKSVCHEYHNDPFQY